MKKAYQIQCLIDGYFDTTYRPFPVIVIAENEEQAMETAKDKIEKHYDVPMNISIEHNGVHEIDGAAGRITVLMEHFGNVDIGIPVLGESTVVTLEDEKEMKVENVSCRNGHIAVSGYTDEKWNQLPLDNVTEDDREVIADALEAVTCGNANPNLRTYSLLSDMQNRTSPYGDEIPANVFRKTRDREPLKAVLTVYNGEPDCIVIRKEYMTGCCQALVIPDFAMEDRDEVIKALEEFCD